MVTERMDGNAFGHRDDMVGVFGREVNAPWYIYPKYWVTRFGTLLNKIYTLSAYLRSVHTCWHFFSAPACSPNALS